MSAVIILQHRMRLPFSQPSRSVHCNFHFSQKRTCGEKSYHLTLFGKKNVLLSRCTVKSKRWQLSWYKQQQKDFHKNKSQLMNATMKVLFGNRHFQFILFSELRLFKMQSMQIITNKFASDSFQKCIDSVSSGVSISCL